MNARVDAVVEDMVGDIHFRVVFAPHVGVLNFVGVLNLVRLRLGARRTAVAPSSGVCRFSTTAGGGLRGSATSWLNR